MTTTRSAAIIAIATVSAGALGVLIGQPLAYVFASVLDRDPAEIKDSFVWCIVLTPVVCAAAGFLLASVAVRSRLSRAAGWSFGFVVAVCCAIVISSYDVSKSSGIPVIEYELAMPGDIHAEGIGNIDLTLWNGKNGQGCYIREIKVDGGRRIVSGTITLPPENRDPKLTIAFHDGNRWTSGGTWDFRFPTDAGIEKQFRPWEAISFTGGVRDLPLAEGTFEVRYRLRRFL